MSIASASAFAEEKIQTAEKPVAFVDQQFVTNAGSGGLTEVMIAKLALEKSHSEEVKTFAQKMVEDHSSANNDLSAIAHNEGMKMPTMLDKKGQKLHDKLAKLDGDKFDQEFMTTMCKDHDATVEEFEKASSQVKNASLRDFATKTQHDQMAHTIGMKKD